MKPADLLYSVPGRARRENTERTTKESGPPGQESSGLEAQGSSSFVHGFGREGEGRGMGKSRYRRHAIAPTWVCPQTAAGKPSKPRGNQELLSVAGFPPASVPPQPPTGRLPHNPWRAVKGTTALSPSPAPWSPRASRLPSPVCRGAHFFATEQIVQRLPGPLYTSDIRENAAIGSNSSRSQALCGYRSSQSPFQVKPSRAPRRIVIPAPPTPRSGSSVSSSFRRRCSR